MIVKYWCKIHIDAPWKSTGNWRDVRIWLIDNCGRDDYEISHERVDRDDIHRRVYFAKEKDAIMFALKWCNYATLSTS